MQCQSAGSAGIKKRSFSPPPVQTASGASRSSRECCNRSSFRWLDDRHKGRQLRWGIVQEGLVRQMVSIAGVTSVSGRSGPSEQSYPAIDTACPHLRRASARISMEVISWKAVARLPRPGIDRDAAVSSDRAYNMCNGKDMQKGKTSKPVYSIFLLNGWVRDRIVFLTHLPRLSPERVTRILGRYFYAPTAACRAGRMR